METERSLNEATPSKTLLIIQCFYPHCPQRRKVSPANYPNFGSLDNEWENEVVIEMNCLVKRPLRGTELRRWVVGQLDLFVHWGHQWVRDDRKYMKSCGDQSVWLVFLFRFILENFGGESVEITSNHCYIRLTGIRVKIFAKSWWCQNICKWQYLHYFKADN